MEAECCAPVWGVDCRPTSLRRRASRPQLKRDPLGGARPPRRRSFVNSFGMVIARARSADALEGSPVRGAPPPQGRGTVCRAAHLLPSGGCPQATSQSNGGRGLPAVRGALVHRCKERRLTRAWSWRRPAASVEFHL